MPQRLTDYEPKVQQIIVREFLKVGGSNVSKSDEGRVRVHLDTNPEALMRITDKLGITENGSPNPDFNPDNPREADKTVVNAIDAALLQGDGVVEDTAITPEDEKQPEVAEEEDVPKNGTEDEDKESDDDILIRELAGK